MEYAFFIASALVSLLVNARGWFSRRPVRKILVFKLDHLGDVVTATPALSHLRALHPEAEITGVIGPWARPLMKAHPALDRILIYASPEYIRGAPLRVAPNLSTVLRSRSYDLIVGLRDDRASLAYAARSGAGKRVDRGTVRIRMKIKRWAARLGFDPGFIPTHEVETNLCIVGHCEPPGSGVRPSLPIAGQALEWFQRERPGLVGDVETFAVIHPGAASPLRKWPRDRFVQVARWLRDGRGLGVIITGSREEAEETESIAEEVGIGAASVARSSDLEKTVAVISQASALVSVDTGIMHVGTAVGTPVVALIGPQDPRRFGPFGPDHIVLYGGLPCSPCSQKDCERGNPECMEAISPDDVIAALTEILDRLPEGHPPPFS